MNKNENKDGRTPECLSRAVVITSNSGFHLSDRLSQRWHFYRAGICQGVANMRKTILAGVVLAATMTFALGSAPASAFGYGYGCGGCGYYAPRYYGYSYYRPAYGYRRYYRPRFFYGGFYRPRIYGWRGWGWRGWGWRGWRRW
jgi:hypothetical protein